MPAEAAQSRRPHDTPFKQQKLKAWQPILTPKSVICTFVTIAVVFIPIGAAILDASDSVTDAGPFRYDNDENEDTGVTTFLKFSWPEDSKDTVYLYYQLSNFYQNHRRYVRSRSDIQLSGSSQGDKDILGDCAPWKTFEDHLPNTYDEIDPEPPLTTNLNPCGLIANSIFNDTFELIAGDCNDQGSCATLPNVSWTKKGIAWSSDRDKKFKNLDGWSGEPDDTQQADVEDEEFIVWMRTAGLPTFKKLHRIIKPGSDGYSLRKGDYTMIIDQEFPVHDFDGEKAIYLTTTTWIGGKNDFLGWAYISVGIMCLLLAVMFFVKHKLDPRAMGDHRAMKDWK